MLPFRAVIYGRLKVFVVEDFSSPLTDTPIKVIAPLLINSCAIPSLGTFRYVLLGALQVLSIFLSLHFSLQNIGGLITLHRQVSDGS